MKTLRTQIASTIAAHTYYDGVSKAYCKQIAALLMADGRVGELDSLLRDIQVDWAIHGYVEVLARSAHPLTEAVEKDIVTRVKQLYPAAERVVVTGVEDPSVIGGVRLDLADKQLDLSIEAKLNRFKQLTGAGKE
jgi:F-type H+-transporting ATPase subunit O